MSHEAVRVVAEHNSPTGVARTAARRVPAPDGIAVPVARASG